MAYTVAWNESYPSNANAANIIGTYITQTKTMVRERLDDIFGTSGGTSIETADPYLPILLKLSGSATSRIIPGATSFAVRNNANSRDNLLISDAGNVTVYKDLRVDTGQAYIDRYSYGNSTTAATIDWANGNTQAITLTGDCTLTLNNPISGAFYTLEIKQDATGNRTITWPVDVKWSGDVEPVLTLTGLKTDIISLYYNGTNYIGVLAGSDFDV